MWLFVVRMNTFSRDSEGDRNIGESITRTGGRVRMERAKKKWVDDLTQVVSINLSEDTVSVTAKSHQTTSLESQDRTCPARLRECCTETADRCLQHRG